MDSMSEKRSVALTQEQALQVFEALEVCHSNAQGPGPCDGLMVALVRGFPALAEHATVQLIFDLAQVEMPTTDASRSSPGTGAT